jgi:soluble lytic murein transglycosylase-like protein
VATTTPSPVAAGGAAATSPEVVCAVQHAVRWREAAWTERECRDRARDFADAGRRWGFSPTQLAAMSLAESDFRVRAWRVDGSALDEGLMGVRCVVGRLGRCTNWPVRGLTPRQLLEPRRNIMAGTQILADLHHGDVAGYNGDHSGTDRYPRKVAAIAAALGGVEVRVRGRRLRELVRKIAAAVTREKKS